MKIKKRLNFKIKKSQRNTDGEENKKLTKDRKLTETLNCLRLKMSGWKKDRQKPARRQALKKKTSETNSWKKSLKKDWMKKPQKMKSSKQKKLKATVKKTLRKTTWKKKEIGVKWNKI